MKIILFITALFIGFSVNTYCQIRSIISSPISNDTIPIDPYTAVDQMPCFPGGETELYKFLGTQIHYPDSAKKLGLQGKLYVEFIVCKSGKICDFKIRKGMIGKGCEEEAIRALKNMPDWIPGKLNGETVAVRYTLPVVFKLNNDTSNLILEICDEMPQYPGGGIALYQYINQNFKYPEIARKQGLQGKLVVEFVIRKNGEITDVKIIKGSIGGGCEEEAIRVLKNMKGWVPGIQHGIPANVRFRMPLNIDLQKILSKKEEHPDKISDQNWPKYIGGKKEMYHFLDSNFVYPTEAKNKGLHGTIYIDLLVKASGKIGNVKISRGHIGGGCEEEAIRIFKMMPDWTPATKNGKPIDVNLCIPLRIYINKPDFTLFLNGYDDAFDRIDVYKTVDEQAKFRGGQEAINKLLAKKIKLPKTNSKGELATYKAELIISNEGKLIKINIISNTQCKICEDEVYAAIEKLQNWIPAKLNGFKVASTYALNITINNLIKK